MKSFPFPKGAP